MTLERVREILKLPEAYSDKEVERILDLTKKLAYYFLQNPLQKKKRYNKHTSPTRKISYD